MHGILRLAAIVGTLALSGAVFAADGGNAGTSQTPPTSGGDGSKAGPCGAAHGAFADVNGNFGFLGQAGGTPGYHNGAVGQDPGATGYNNSHSSCHTQQPS